MYNAIIAKVDEVFPHPNADRIKLARVLGTQVVVSMETKVDDVVVLFPDDGQLSTEYATANDLVGYTDESGEKKGGYFDHKRKVRCQKFRGEKSEAYVAPLSSLSFTGYDISILKIGDKFNELNGITICNKYITKATKDKVQPKVKDKSKFYSDYKKHIKELFKEHMDTDQFRHNAHNIEKGSLITITAKLHGTSGRATNIPTLSKLNMFQRVANLIFFKNKEHTEYEVVHGTRRVILYDANHTGFYGSDKFRDKVLDKIKSCIPKNYCVYYEITGFTENGAPIMPPVDTKKLGDKEIAKRFANPMIYKYGSMVGDCDVHVYRMTVTNPDGEIEELPWSRVKKICKDNGIKHVPEIDSFIYDGDLAKLKAYVEHLTDGVDVAEPLDNSHIREGICIRVDDLNGKTKIYKSKTFIFRMAEGLVKDSEVEDREEIEDIRTEG